jgi:hypothetical protein
VRSLSHTDTPVLRHVREARHFALTRLRSLAENGVHRSATKPSTHLSRSFLSLQFLLHRFAHAVAWLTFARSRFSVKLPGRRPAVAPRPTAIASWRRLDSFNIETLML